MIYSKIFIKGLIFVFALTFIFASWGCKSSVPKIDKVELKMCDTDIKSKCSGDCIDGFEPRYYFDSRNIQSAIDEAEKRVAFLKRQGLGDLSDYPEILNNEKKNASFAQYIPPQSLGGKPKFILNGKEVPCEEFYQSIEKLNNACGGCVEIVPEKLEKK